ncbi:MAG: c-type cytochrome [Rhodospirillaceae bacterium]|nr:c-type cytochrome [Rhodospirillaceae bacterium]
MKFIAFLLAALVAGPAAAADADLQRQCGECHAFEKPADATLDRLWTRKGPDLWYAGAKFNRAWLVKWLQKPTAIRAGGVMWFKHAKPGEPRDTIDPAGIAPHPSVDAAAADKLADALMTLTGGGIVDAAAFKPEGANLSMGKLAFGKLRGCTACHQEKPGTGGVSAPELYDAGERLQPGYVLAYTKNPQAFDPHIWMPRLELTDVDLQRITAYVASLKAGE